MQTHRQFCTGKYSQSEYPFLTDCDIQNQQVCLTFNSKQLIKSASLSCFSTLIRNTYILSLNKRPDYLCVSVSVKICLCKCPYSNSH